MPSPSRPPTFKAYGVKPECYECGSRIRADDPATFVGAGYTSPPAVFCRNCHAAAAQWALKHEATR